MEDVTIKVFKLSTGEEVIAELVKEEDEHYYCKTPFGVGVNQQGNLVFVPYMQYTNAAEEIILHKHHVMIIADPVQSIYDDYMRATRKIYVPTRSILTPVPN
jgi:hypothetical protein